MLTLASHFLWQGYLQAARQRERRCVSGAGSAAPGLAPMNPLDPWGSELQGGGSAPTQWLQASAQSPVPMVCRHPAVGGAPGIPGGDPWWI